ncbi:MAG: hypothetical protein WCL31_02475 [Actinomycetes bacterium]
MAALGNPELNRIVAAAQTPLWEVEVGEGNTIVATRDSGVDGMPYAVVIRRSGRGYRASLYMPGDDTTVEGDVIGEAAGNPRETGRQIRALLEDADLSSN